MELTVCHSADSYLLKHECVHVFLNATLSIYKIIKR